MSALTASRSFQVVVEQDPGQSTPGREGCLVTTQEVGHARIEEEAQKDLAREAQHHDERHQGPFGLPHDELSEVPPVDLALLTRQGLQAQIGLRLWARPVVCDQMPKVILPPAVTTLAHHGIEAAGGEAGVLLQGLEHKGQVGVDQRSPVRPLRLGQPGL